MDYAAKLAELATRFGSDKVTLGYMPLYSEYLNRAGLKPENIKNVLEIGTNKGSSLRLWAEFFPNATIHGIDITRQYEIAEHLAHPRIITHLVNQGSRSELEAFIEYAVRNIKFDIIIDDGSHDQSDQQLSLGMLFPILSSGGLYIIEDLITGENWWDGRTYNRRKVKPTRNLIQEFEQTGKLPDEFVNKNMIENSCFLCNYRESSAQLFHPHHPQIAFIGKK